MKQKYFRFTLLSILFIASSFLSSCRLDFLSPRPVPPSSSGAIVPPPAATPPPYSSSGTTPPSTSSGLPPQPPISSGVTPQPPVTTSGQSPCPPCPQVLPPSCPAGERLVNLPPQRRVSNGGACVCVIPRFRCEAGNTCLVTGCFQDLCIKAGDRVNLPNCPPLSSLDPTKLAETKCYQNRAIARCEKLSGTGTCAWSMTPALRKCLDDAKQQERCVVKRGGCNNEVQCLRPNQETLATTCEARLGEDCNVFARCDKQSNGECGFSQTQEYAACLARNAQSVCPANQRPTCQPNEAPQCTRSGWRCRATGLQPLPDQECICPVGRPNCSAVQGQREQVGSQTITCQNGTTRQCPTYTCVPISSPPPTR